MKRAMKLISIICVIAMMLSCTVFAYAPSYYDGTAYTTLGLDSDDEDGVINLAVIAKSNVILGDVDDIGSGGSVNYICGSIYSGGNIQSVDGAGNTVDGLFISGTGDHTYDGATGDFTAVGYEIVDRNGNSETTTAYDSKPTYAGAIDDKNTSFECTYTDYTVPAITNTTANIGYYEFVYDYSSWELVEVNYVNCSTTDVSGTIGASQYGGQWNYTNSPVVYVTEDTHFGTLSIDGNGMIVDATNGSIDLVIDYWDNSKDGYFTVYGDNPVNIYVKDAGGNNGDDTYKLYTQSSYNELNDAGIIGGTYADMDDLKSDIASVNGNENVTFYLGSADSDTVNIVGSYAYADVVSNVGISAGKTTYIVGDFVLGGDFTMSASNAIWGTVCAPNSDTFIGNSATLYGQLHTNTLEIGGAGAIIYQSDSLKSASASEATATPEAEATAEPTAAPATATPAATTAPSSGIYLDIVEDVLYVVPGGTVTINIDHNTYYDWDWSENNIPWKFNYYNTEDIGDLASSWSNHDNPYWTDTFYDTQWYATPAYANVGDEYVLKAVSQQDSSVYDTVKIIVVDTLEKAKIVRYTVATGEYARGTMDTKIHYPARGTNLDGEEEDEISYEVLDETTFTVTGPQYISDKTKAEVQEILTTTNDVFIRLAADDSDLQSSARHTFNASRFGRIDSNGVDYSLSINPYVYPQIKDDITTMYLCWGDQEDEVEVIWYVIPQADLDAGL